jgi:hypothetical protein
MESLPALNGPASIEAYSDNLQQKLHFCSVMLKSGMVPSTYKTPESILIAVLFGKELGFSPIRSLYSISVIQGTPTINAQAMKALAISKGAKIKATEWNENKCSLTFERGDWKEDVSYSIQDAESAGLAGKDNWKKNRKAMLYARAVSIGCRNQWADVLGGMYSTEEIIDAKREDDSTEAKYEAAAQESVLDKIAPRKGDVEVEADPDWYSFKYVYALPDKVEGKNMFQVKAHLKTVGFKLNPEDGFWYGNRRMKDFSEYQQNGAPEVEPDPLPKQDIVFEMPNL